MSLHDGCGMCVASGASKSARGGGVGRRLSAPTPKRVQSFQALIF